MNIINRRHKSTSVFYLKYSRFPRFYIPAIRKNGNAHGVILFHRLFIGIEKIRRLNGGETWLTWNWGLKPIKQIRRVERDDTPNAAG